jgi:Ca2+-binding RTX toxin-like protein
VDSFANIQNFDGSSGDDTFVSGPGNFQFYGEGGYDRLDYSWDAADVTVDLPHGTVDKGWLLMSNGRLGIPVRQGTDAINSIESFIGGSGNDRFIVSNGNFTMIGNAGKDTFDFSGVGSATFTGGAGADVFDYRTDAAHMRVTDFQQGVDHISLGKLALASLTITDTAKGEVITFHGGSDMTIMGVHHLTQADFIV